MDQQHADAYGRMAQTKVLSLWNEKFVSFVQKKTTNKKKVWLSQVQHSGSNNTATGQLTTRKKQSSFMHTVGMYLKVLSIPSIQNLNLTRPENFIEGMKIFIEKSYFYV